MHSVLVAVQVEAPAARVWELIGDPSTIAEWHPLMRTSTQEGDIRTVTLEDGGEIQERIDEPDETGRSYRYTNVGGPLPVRNYRAILCVKEVGPSRCLAEWSSTFEAVGAPAPDVVERVKNVYLAGLDAVRAKM